MEKEEGGCKNEPYATLEEKAEGEESEVTEKVQAWMWGKAG